MAKDPKAKKARPDEDRCCPDDENQLISEDEIFLEDEEEGEDEEDSCPTCFI
jgi:hypothetical protein